MTAAKKITPKGIDEKGLKKLIPLSTLSIDRLREIADKASVESLPATRTLFKYGDHDTKTYYLLSGEVEVQLPSGQNILVKSDTPAALHPLSDVRPRQSTVVAKTTSTILGIDRALLEILINDGRHAYEVNEIQAEDEADWMTRFLQLLSVMNVPVKNIEHLIQNMEEYPVRAGDVVIRQSGRNAEHYFVVKQGRCAVTKQAGADKTPIRVAELGEGTGFGEEALLAQQPRGATVTMLTDGCLMRLSKSEFHKFIAEPALKFVSYAEAAEMIGSGAVWLDVRGDSDFRRNGLPGALHLPLNLLRSKFRDLNTYGKYVACADTPQRAAAAAFVLRQLGYSVCVLNEGLGQGASRMDTKTDVNTPSAPPTANLTNSPKLKAYAPPAVTDVEPTRPAHDAGSVNDDLRSQELERAQREIQSLRAQVNDARAREQEASQRYAQSQDGATRDLESAKGQSARLQQRLAQLEQDRGAKSQELDRLREELEHARAQAREELREMSQRAADHVNQHVVEAREEVRIAQERANEFSLNLAATEAAHDATRNEIQQLQAELKRLRAEWKREQSELAAAKEAQAKEIESMKQNFDREMERKRAAEEALRNAEAEAARLKAEVDAARKRADELSKRASETESMHATMLSEAKRKAEAAEALRREADEQARRLRDAAEQSRKRAEDEVRRVAEMEAARQKAVEESQRRSTLAEEIRRKADEEIARLKAEAEQHARHAEEARKKAMAAESARRSAESQSRAAAPPATDDIGDLEQELVRLQKKLESKKRSAISRKEEIERAAPPAKDEPELQQNVYDISQKTQKIPAFKPNQGPPNNVGKVRKSGWVSDAILWETTLGLREDEEAESLLRDAQPDAAPQPSTPAPAPTAQRPEPSGEIKTRPTFAARDVAPNVGQRKVVDLPPRKSRMGLVIAVAVAALAGGGIALVATDRISLPKEIVSPAGEQRDAQSSDMSGRDEMTTETPSVESQTMKARTMEENSSGTILRKASPSATTDRKATSLEKPKSAAAPTPRSKESRSSTAVEPASSATTRDAAPAAADAPIRTPQSTATPSLPATAPAALTPAEPGMATQQPASIAPAPQTAIPPASSTESAPASGNPQTAVPLSEPRAPSDEQKPAVREFSDKAEVN